MTPEELDKTVQLMVEKYGPRFLNVTLEEFRCWIPAEEEDEDQKQRDNGEMPLSDCHLFLSVIKPFATNETQISHGMEFLRLKRRKGHRQQRALYLWDRYYRDWEYIVFEEDRIRRGTTEEFKK